MDEHVRLLGYVPDEQLPRMYRAADLSIVPTVALEGFGLIAAESLAAGTPVLVTPIGGLPEVVQGLAADLVLPAATEGAIAAGLASALTGRTRLPSEAACSEFARTHYGWPMIAGRIRQTYQEALQA
jgi:glycosyltransferase involved in cell wall biosynthesis